MLVLVITEKSKKLPKLWSICHWVLNCHIEEQILWLTAKRTILCNEQASMLISSLSGIVMISHSSSSTVLSCYIMGELDQKVCQGLFGLCCSNSGSCRAQTSAIARKLNYISLFIYYWDTSFKWQHCSLWLLLLTQTQYACVWITLT